MGLGILAEVYQFHIPDLNIHSGLPVRAQSCHVGAFPGRAVPAVRLPGGCESGLARPELTPAVWLESSVVYRAGQDAPWPLGMSIKGGRGGFFCVCFNTRFFVLIVLLDINVQWVSGLNCPEKTLRGELTENRPS